MAVVAAVTLAVGVREFGRWTSSRVQRRARQQLFAEVQPVHVTNCELQRFGEAHDGGYLVCANLLGAVQAGYSYGIGGVDGWGCDISAQLHVPVHEYDCFDVRRPACSAGRLTFHGECVGPTSVVEDGRPFDTMANQFAKNGDGAKPIVLKMDVEGAEWESFLAAGDSVYKRIDQLIVEFHQVNDPAFVGVVRRLKTFFVVAHLHFNNYSCDPTLAPFPAWAFEVLFVSKRLAQTDGAPGAPSPTALDAVNDPEEPDCQTIGSNSAIAYSGPLGA